MGMVLWQTVVTDWGRTKLERTIFHWKGLERWNLSFLTVKSRIFESTLQSSSFQFVVLRLILVYKMLNHG